MKQVLLQTVFVPWADSYTQSVINSDNDMLLQIQVHCETVIELKATYCMYQITFLVVIEIYSITETFKIKLKSSIRRIFCYERLQFIRMRRVLEKNNIKKKF